MKTRLLIILVCLSTLTLASGQDKQTTTVSKALFGGNTIVSRSCSNGSYTRTENGTNPRPPHRSDREGGVLFDRNRPPPARITDTGRVTQSLTMKAFAAVLRDYFTLKAEAKGMTKRTLLALFLHL